MDNNKTVYQTMREYVENNENLPDETKQDYLNCLDQLNQGKLPDQETMKEVSAYLDHEMELIEEAAIEDHDSDLISKLADIRDSRNELEKAVFMIYDPENKEYQESPEVKDKAIKNLLSKISSVANSQPVAVADKL